MSVILAFPFSASLLLQCYHPSRDFWCDLGIATKIFVTYCFKCVMSNNILTASKESYPEIPPNIQGKWDPHLGKSSLVVGKSAVVFLML